MEIKNAADQDRAYKAEFPELPMQWKNYGYEITEKLGEGISGSVYKLVKNKGEADEEISALKMISWTLNKKMVYREYGNDWVKARRDFTQFFNDKVAHEVSRLESFAGAENIVQIKGSCLEKMPEENFWKLYIQMEYLEDFTEYLGKNYMEKNETMDAEEVIRFGIEICSALEICHEKGIIHRDIKPDNLMVSKEGQFKLGDFGIAREPISGTMTVAGTPDYMAPEVKETTIYDKTADIYSLGLAQPPRPAGNGQGEQQRPHRDDQQKAAADGLRRTAARQPALVGPACPLFGFVFSHCNLPGLPRPAARGASRSAAPAQSFPAQEPLFIGYTFFLSDST